MTSIEKHILLDRSRSFRELSSAMDSGSSATGKPKIIPSPNGPLYLISSDVPKVVENLVNAEHEPVSKIQTVPLCRCGGSRNKPFCDGTHTRIGFSSENKSPPKALDKRKDYFGKNIIVHDNRRICSHSAECLRNLHSVFSLEEKPWIYPDRASTEAVIETVNKCPSGALSYSVDGDEQRDREDRKPIVIVDDNGPYRIEGGIELVGIENWAVGASKEHYTLCRCGASDNKPFCDGTHLSIQFRDGKPVGHFRKFSSS